MIEVFVDSQLYLSIKFKTVTLHLFYDLYKTKKDDTYSFITVRSVFCNSKCVNKEQTAVSQTASLTLTRSHTQNDTHPSPYMLLQLLKALQ